MILLKFVRTPSFELCENLATLHHKFILSAMDRFSIFTLSATSSDDQPVAHEGGGNNSGTYCVIAKSVDVEETPVDSGTYCVVAW